MKYQRSVWHGCIDFLQASKVEPHFSFVESMRRTDRNGQSVNVCFGHKPCRIVCFSQELCCCCGGIIVLSNVAQLSFNRHTSSMCELNHALRHRTVISKGQFRAVDHYGGISLINASGS